MTKNQEVAELLKSFAKYYSIAGDVYRSMAYRRAAVTIESLDKDILIYQNQLEILPMIGPSIAEKIKEYLITGKSSSLEELKREVIKDGFKVEIYEIEGFGPSTIEELFSHFTIRNMEELENVLKSRAIMNLPGFGEKKVKKLLASLEEHKLGGIRRNIPFLEAWSVANSLIDSLKDPNIDKISIAGSLRRMKSTVNDIDIIASIRKPNGKWLLEKFTKLEDVKRIISMGETKAIIVLKNGIQADLRVVQPEEYYTALQYFTGSAEHNIKLRVIAKEKGYLLSEYGLSERDTNIRIPINSEEELYQKLGLPYLEPSKRI